MAEPRARWKLILGWVLTLGIAVYAISEWGDGDEPKQRATSDDTDAAADLRITSISDGEVNPGDAVVVTFTGGDPAPPVEAKLAKRPAEIIVREPGSVVVLIPGDTPTGKAALRLTQGTKRSKAWDLHVRATNHRKLVARLLGGLALFVFGLGLLATGLRGLAGHRVRELLRVLTVSPPRALGVGALVGAVTQLTSSAAALTVSFVEARMLAVTSSVAVLVGAHVGASITGALLPVQLARESLLVIATGVLWTRLARTRRGGSVANLVLGTGLMLYGLHLLQTSVEPLVSDPKILPYLHYLGASDLGSLLTCAATGAVLAFVLQGPGPVYVLVVGLAQTTAGLPLANALAILAGTNLGAALGMAIIAWQADPVTRPLARTQLLFGAGATVLVLVSIPVWTALARAVIPGGAEAVEYGKNVVRSGIAPQLAIGFAAAQLTAAGVWLGVLPVLVARTGRKRVSAAATVASTEFARSVNVELADALERLRTALAIALETSCTGDRTRSPECETAIAESRQLLESRYKAIGGGQVAPEIVHSARTVVAALQLQRAVETTVHSAELGVERGVKLGPEAQQQLTAMHAIAGESFDALAAALAEGVSPDLEEAGAREIRMNMLEAEGRMASVGKPRDSRSSTSSLHIGLAELIDSYENVGNHLFRVTKALAEQTDDI